MQTVLDPNCDAQRSRLAEQSAVQRPSNEPLCAHVRPVAHGAFAEHCAPTVPGALLCESEGDDPLEQPSGARSPTAPSKREGSIKARARRDRRIVSDECMESLIARLAPAVSSRVAYSPP